MQAREKSSAVSTMARPASTPLLHLHLANLLDGTKLDPRTGEDLVTTKTMRVIAAAAIGLMCGGTWPAHAQATYPAMAPLNEYLISDKDAEVALARSAAPKSISDGADVMVLGKDGYTTASKGGNGFLCIVERSWGAATDDAQFWNPKVRAPICFNPPAARTFVPIYLMKTRLLLAGKSKAETVKAVAAALDSKEVPALEPGAMCYMMSKQQYLTDSGKSWHPHLMFIVPGDATKNSGADLPGSPVIAANDPEERATILMVWVGKWSDETPGPPM